MELDSNSHIPLHIQLKEFLRNEIIQGKISGKIPSEREHMKQFSVSRTTVREAISGLVSEGILIKVHGKGTFVNFHPVTQWLGDLESYTEAIERLGMKPGARLMFQGIVPVPKNLADDFKSFEVYKIERVRYANEMITAIERKFFPLDIGRELAKYDMEDANIYQILEKSIGVTLWKAEEAIWSSNPSKEDAKLLKIPRNSSVLIIERKTIDPNGRIIEYVTDTFAADKYVLRINMSRK